MSDDSGDDDAEFTAGFYEDSFKRFEELGEDQVSSMLLSGEILPQNRDAARVWLGRKAGDRSKKSKRSAISASTITIISIIVAIVGIAISHLDAVRTLFH